MTFPFQFGRRHIEGGAMVDDRFRVGQRGKSLRVFAGAMGQGEKGEGALLLIIAKAGEHGRDQCQQRAAMQPASLVDGDLFSPDGCLLGFASAYLWMDVLTEEGVTVPARKQRRRAAWRA
jgi:hypothetical protein